MMEGFRPTSSSPGEALIVHDDAYDARIYDNIIRDSTLGIVSSGRSGHIIDNDTIVAPIRIDVQGGVTGTIQQ